MNENNFNKRMADLEHRYSDSATSKTSEPLKTGFEELDGILHGGLPKGGITEIYGASGTGKTTLALNIIKEAQKEGKISLYFDCDYSWNKQYAEKIGIDFDTFDVIVSKPNEYMLQAIENLIKNNLIDVIVIDTITSLAIGRKQLFDILRNLSATIKKNNITVIVLSQVRHNFNSEETVVYKELMEYYVTLRIRIKYITSKKKDGKLLYKTVETKVMQNKFDDSHPTAVINIRSGE